jgi:hypothetical protein
VKPNHRPGGTGRQLKNVKNYSGIVIKDNLGASCPAPTIPHAIHFALWDPWGLFFIHLTHESGISDYKGMNLGWMNLG